MSNGSNCRKTAEKGGKGRKRAEKGGKERKTVEKSDNSKQRRGQTETGFKKQTAESRKRGKRGTAVPNGSNLREIAEKSGKGRKRAEKSGKEWKRVKWQTKKSPGR